MDEQLMERLRQAKEKLKKYAEENEIPVLAIGIGKEVLRVTLTPEARDNFDISEINGFQIEFTLAQSIEFDSE